MKLFKKLAAAALAAVLALAMVGCGSSASLKDELLKVAMDQMTMNGRTANHKAGAGSRQGCRAGRAQGRCCKNDSDSRRGRGSCRHRHQRKRVYPQCSSECSVQEQRSAYGVHSAAVDAGCHQPVDGRWIQQSREDRNDHLYANHAA